MSRRIHDLDVSAIDDLPDPCRACVFWEVSRGRRGAHAQEAVGRQAKEAWWQATQLEWGIPGKIVCVDDICAGYATFAPAEHFPRVRRLHRPSDDAILLATLWVRPDLRGQGIATMLLQSVLREVHRRGGRALEAYGERTVSPAEKPCMIPEAFLLSRGFLVLGEHHRTPLLRLEMRQTAKWQEVGTAISEVIATLTRRERSPSQRPVLQP